jgi:beta-glucuronidase
MHRTFQTTTTRKQTYLHGRWDFVADPDDVGVSEEWCCHFPEDSIEMYVPGVWNTHRAYLNYEGPAWYRYRFSIDSCPAMAICFGAVTHQANVWLDDEPLGEHYGGFLPFSFLVPHPKPGEHELIVRVDNTHDMISTIPAARLDWFRYGGIPRPVWVEELQGDAYIASLRVTPVLTGDKATLRVRSELLNLTDSRLDTEWTLFVDERPLRSEGVQIEAHGSQVILFAVDVDDARIWRPQDPALHMVRLACGGDDLIERTGFRSVRVEGTQILLNDEPIRILGVNRHEDHPDWGFALPEHMMLRDLDLLADLGANSIRGSHYPNDPRMLDLCDERGILFIEEIPLWGFSREQLAQELISDRAAAMLWAMVERDAGHPCIWAWSVLNECATDTPEGRVVAERLISTVRELDSTRPVTFASDRGTRDICMDLVDFVCLNAYPGWYAETTWPEFLNRMRAKIGNKPMIVSEFGAGAIYGWHALEEGVVWSEEHQRCIVADAVACFLERDDLVGFYIWQYFDTRTDGGEWALRRPRNFNNKGLLDEYRRPKLVYYAVRDLLKQV